MNARATFKIAVTVFVLFVGLGAVVLVCTWAYQKFQLGWDPLPDQVINDSLKVYREKAAIHFDSSQFYQRKYENLTLEADSVSADSLVWAGLVAEYSANLRRTIAREILDSIARQRGEIRAFEATYVDTSKKLRIHGTGKLRPEK